MLVVLSHSEDLSARWAYDRLRDQFPDPVELVLVEDLNPLTTVWRHELARDVAHTDIRLADGRRLRTGHVTSVLNRMLQPPLMAVTTAVPADAAYAVSELTAFAASWIRALAPRVLNEPTPQGLSGRWRPAMHWRLLALDAGLPTAPFTFNSRSAPLPNELDSEPSTTVLSIGGEPVANYIPDEIRDGLRRFAAAAQTPILGIRFAGSDPPRSGWRVLDATPHPDLTIAGDKGIVALAAHLAL